MGAPGERRVDRVCTDDGHRGWSSVPSVHVGTVEERTWARNAAKVPSPATRSTRAGLRRRLAATRHRGRSRARRWPHLAQALRPGLAPGVPSTRRARRPRSGARARTGRAAGGETGETGARVRRPRYQEHRVSSLFAWQAFRLIDREQPHKAVFSQCPAADLCALARVATIACAPAPMCGSDRSGAKSDRSTGARGTARISPDASRAPILARWRLPGDGATGTLPRVPRGHAPWSRTSVTPRG